MARVNNSAKSTSKNPSVAEIRKWYTENKANIENYAKAKESFRQLRDTTKTSTRSIKQIDKETLKTYFSSIASN